MICPKCNAQKMVRDIPVYFNRENQEGDTLYLEVIYQCRICGKVIYLHKEIKVTPKRFIRGQVIVSGYENL